MVPTPDGDRCPPIPTDWQLLLIEQERARLAELERTLRTKNLRIATLEQRLEHAREQERPSGPCLRCAQFAKSWDFFADRIRQQDRRLRELERENAAQAGEIEALKKRNAELERRTHRSAAPFRRPPEERTTEPKPRGRPEGHPGTWRRPPAAPLETEEVPLECCPHCQGTVTQVGAVEQVICELPLPVTPRLRRIVTYTGTCAQCGHVRSLHPWQVSTAVGAAGVHLGPQALAIAADLRHGHGLPLRRTCRVLDDLFGLSLSSGGLSQALMRMAQTVRPDYELLIEELRASAVVYVDETGWWLEHMGAWLWVFTTPRITVYHISRQRSGAALAEILGDRYGGVLVSDCLRVYDRYPAEHKSKCVSHHQRKIAEAHVELPESAFLTAMRRLMKAALKLKRSRERLSAAVYERGIASLEERLTQLLAPTYEQAKEEKVAQRFRNQREHIFTFLRHPEVGATNNLAERQLRPAVITRKLSWGNDTEAGARTWEVLASLAATCRQRGAAFVAFMAERLRLGSAHTGLAPPTPA